MGRPVQTSAKMMKLISTLALVAAASAQYAPAPVVVAKEIPQPYAYEYGVADDYSNSNFRKTETQDANGNVGGSFTIALPDGRIQTTTYTLTLSKVLWQRLLILEKLSILLLPLV